MMTSILTVRNRQFCFDEIPLYWCNGSALFTCAFNSFSYVTLYFESFFIKTSRKVLPILKNEAFKNELEMLIEQETAHIHAHNQLNKISIKQGYNLRMCKKIILKFILIFEKLSLKKQILFIIGVENLGYHLSLFVLRNFKNNNEAMRFQLWHAYEEIEHRTTPFKLYQELYGKNPTRLERLFGLISGFLNGFSVFLVAAVYCLYKGKLKLKDFDKPSLKMLFGPHGFLRYQGISFAKFYKKDYNPADDEVPDFVREYQP